MRRLDAKLAFEHAVGSLDVAGCGCQPGSEQHHCEDEVPGPQTAAPWRSRRQQHEPRVRGRPCLL